MDDKSISKKPDSKLKPPVLSASQLEPTVSMPAPKRVPSVVAKGPTTNPKNGIHEEDVIFADQIGAKKENGGKPAVNVSAPVKPEKDFATLAMTMQTNIAMSSPQKSYQPGLNVSSTPQSPNEEIQFVQRKPRKAVQSPIPGKTVSEQERPGINDISFENQNLAQKQSPNTPMSVDRSTLAPTVNMNNCASPSKDMDLYSATVASSNLLDTDTGMENGTEAPEIGQTLNSQLPANDPRLQKTMNMSADDPRLQKTVNQDFSAMAVTSPSPHKIPPKKDPFNLLGSVLVGKYELVGFLGQGGMGAVYLAKHKVLGKERAIKFLYKTPEISPTTVRRFINEARAAAKVEHPNIVQVYDIEETDQFYFIVMEYVKGQGVDDLLKKKGALSEWDAIKIVKPAALGLCAIHNAGMVHRDIKPANLMLTEAGQVKIMDFGIVKEISSNTAALTGAGTILGTPQFMSPEQVKNGEIGCKSDMYSLGATFYTLVTNRPCFQGTTMQLIYQILSTPPIPPHEINKALSLTISGIILKMLEKEPDNRYENMTNVFEILEKHETTNSGKARNE